MLHTPFRASSMGQGQSGGAGFPGQAPGADKKKEVRQQGQRWSCKRRNANDELRAFARSIPVEARCPFSGFHFTRSFRLSRPSLARHERSDTSKRCAREAKNENEKEKRRRRRRKPERQSEQAKRLVEARPLPFSPFFLQPRPLRFTHSRSLSQNSPRDDSNQQEKKKKWEPPAPPPRIGRKERRRDAAAGAAGRLPAIVPTAKCRLRLLKLERLKDWLLMEEEFVASHEALKPKPAAGGGGAEAAPGDDEDGDRSKVEDLRGSPMSVGTLEEIVDESHAIVSSSVGPEYYVSIMSFVDRSLLEPGCSVLLHNKVRRRREF